MQVLLALLLLNMILLLINSITNFLDRNQGMEIIKVTTLFPLMQLLPVIQTISDLYPDVEHWYINKAIPRVLLGEDNVFVVKNESGEIAGFAIAKKTEKESKLCCIKIMPDYQSKGYSIALIKAVQQELGSDYLHCSVSEDLFHAYSRLFINHFGWSVDDVQKDVYKKGKLEYFFNGKMKKESDYF